MAKRTSGTAEHPRVQLGPFWLWYRRDRDDWCICWYDDSGAGSGRTCRKSTGIGGGSASPPTAAQDALADHYAGWRAPVQDVQSAAFVENIMADWLTQHAYKNLHDPGRYATSIAHWQRFFAGERQAGRLTGAPTVADVRNALVARFVTMREAEGVGKHAIARDIAALRQPLNWAWKSEMIASVPFVPDVTGKPGPKSIVYTVDQVAALLEAAWSREEWRHIHLYTMIALSTHGRGEAILELEAETQVVDGLIYFNAPGRTQTKKRRSIVPIAPTLAPWLADARGRVIRCQFKKRGPDGEWIIERRPVERIKRAFESVLIEAGICEHATDSSGEPLWLPPRGKLKESRPRPALVGIGSPNTLRHTCSTEMHRRGVPEAQIDMAAGHAGTGTNQRHYRHLRPEYLKGFIEGVEDLWADISRLTTAHLRYQRDTKVISLGAVKARKRS